MMDASTLSLHRQWLRLAKGAVNAYEKWLDEQVVEALTVDLKQQRHALKTPLDKTENSS